ncbi:endopeptidase La [candidate division CSSED10-310 bacterium]|uniref:Lon protease n=1 Tax=candidate division CSSED10-310 bacterium TaxID=2855610 RepID=A0ABV6YZH7_UNCC1
MMSFDDTSEKNIEILAIEDNEESNTSYGANKGSGDANQDDEKIILATEVLPENLIIIPVQNKPLFPGMMLPILVSGKFVKSVHFADGNDKTLGLLLLKSKEKDVLIENDFYHWGTAAKILGVHRNLDDTLQVLLRTMKRFKVEKFLRFDPHIVVRVHYPDEIQPEMTQEAKALLRSLVIEMQTVIKENQLISNELKGALQNIDFSNPGLLSDVAASLTSAEAKDQQQILETIDVIDRMRKVLLLLKKEMDLISLQKQISQEIQEKISKQQREFMLHEQMRVIKKELGIEMDDKSLEVKRIEEKLLKLKFPEQVREKIDNDLQKMKLTEPHSPEFGVIRNYLDIITSLPWRKYSRDITDLNRARRILNQDHYGLEDIKNRIIEFIATMKIKKNVQGSMICLVGPPGVGKTSVGKSIARALNRKFYRFSLGGMRDEAEIKGHRRTYIGAMPGKIINGLKYCGTANPVLMLDEIDKLSHSYMGDPSSALLEVLDPEQNSDFVDHYLDVPFDLSRILFITTANTLDTIPAPLLDRMEIMRLSGYIGKEKVEIGRRFLLPKQLQAHGLTRDNLDINRNALAKIAQDYAREAGVRTMEKNIATICRKVTTRLADGDTKKVSIGIRNLVKFLGKPRFRENPLEKDNPPGVSTGLAWTSMGGAVLKIESTSIAQKRGFKQTGHLGEVMIESSSIAYSFVNSALERYGGQPDYFNNNFVHLHVPEGATPKDGPSAGTTMALAILSLALGRKIRKGLAMTGELTLTGNVLPIGGLREKIIAARRNKVQEVILPKLNETDFDELKDYLKKGITFHLVDHFDEIKEIAFS